MSIYHLTQKSSNGKTGPIPVSTTSANTCPPECPFIGGACYAKSGWHLRQHWAKVSDPTNSRGSSLEAFAAKISALPEGQVWRHNQAGDLPGTGSVIDEEALQTIIDANKGKRGFTYTHKPTAYVTNREAIRKANQEGFAVNLSANHIGQVDELMALGIGPVTTVLPSDHAQRVVTTDGGNRVVTCPATLPNSRVQCATCGGKKGPLCARIGRDYAIGFPAHGSPAGKQEANKLASEGAK